MAGVIEDCLLVPGGTSGTEGDALRPPAAPRGGPRALVTRQQDQSGLKEATSSTRAPRPEAWPPWPTAPRPEHIKATCSRSPSNILLNSTWPSKREGWCPGHPPVTHHTHFQPENLASRASHQAPSAFPAHLNKRTTNTHLLRYQNL